ncbi:MAG: energy transducer TonB [Pseudomonadales bacterium]
MATRLSYQSTWTFPRALGLALLVHTVIVFGLSFSGSLSKPPVNRLEVTLSSFKSELAPDKADYIARSNQQGSGTKEKKSQLTTTELATYADIEIRDTSKSMRREAQLEQITQRQLISSRASVKKATTVVQQDKKDFQEASAGESPEEHLSLQIASLEARLDRQRKAYAHRPRVHRITSLSTRAAVDAQYQLQWQQKVEWVGNKHYPEQARLRQLEGDVRLLVSLLPDGSIKTIQILSSSGHALLDAAAMKSVHLAAPFQPFPPEIAKKTDILEIIRTWQFRQDYLSSSS